MRKQTSCHSGFRVDGAITKLIVSMDPHLKVLLGCQCHRTSDIPVDVGLLPLLKQPCRDQSGDMTFKNSGDLYTLPKTNIDPDCLAPWKCEILYQPVVFRVHVSPPGCNSI